MSRSYRTIQATLLALVLALPATALFSDGVTGGGGGITILPLASSITQTRTSATFTNYASSGITIALPAGTTVFTAAFMLPGQSTPSVVIASQSSSLHIPGEILAQYFEVGIHSFSIKISTLNAVYSVDVSLKSAIVVDISY